MTEKNKQNIAPDLTENQAKDIKDTNTLIKEALKNWALNKLEWQEIMNRLKQEKQKVSLESRQELLDIAKKWGWTGLVKIIETKTETRVVQNETSTETSSKSADPVESKKEEPTQEDKSVLDKTWEFISSSFDNVKNLFSSWIDLENLPENDKKIVKELQEAWFKLKPVEWQKWVYEVDMNSLGDKSILTILSDWKMKFSTDTIKFAWKDKQLNFEDVNDAKDLLTKVNEYINVSFEIKPLEDIYESHRDFSQQDRYIELRDIKKALEIDLWLIFDIK